jgi:hypothetical protein
MPTKTVTLLILLLLCIPGLTDGSNSATNGTDNSVTSNQGDTGEGDNNHEE